MSARGRGKFLSAGTDSDEERKKPRQQETLKPTLVKMNLQVRPELAQQLREYAVKHRMKIYEVVEQVLSRLLDDNLLQEKN